MYSEPRFSMCPHCPTFITFTNNNPQRRIDRHAAPIPPAQRARKKQRVAFERQWRVRAADLHPIRFKQFLAKACMFRRAVIHVLQAKVFLANGGGFSGKRLRLRSYFPRHRVWGTGRSSIP